MEIELSPISHVILYFFFIMLPRNIIVKSQNAVLNSVDQHSMLAKFGGKWATKLS